MSYNISVSKFPFLEEALDNIGGLEKYVKKNARVFIKPNVCVPKKNETGAVTSPELISELIKLLQPISKEISLGECPITGYRYMENLKVSGVYDEVLETGVNIVNLNQDEKVKLDGFYIPRSVLDCDVFINMPIMKTHERTGVTLSLKNIMGILPGKQKRAMHKKGLEKGIVDLNKIVKSHLVVVDANNCQEGSGPIHGELKKVGLIVVGDNPVAVDSICCKIMGVDPYLIEHIKMAYDMGLGPISEDNINVVGLERDYIQKFRLPFMFDNPIVRLSLQNFEAPFRSFFEKIYEIEFNWDKCTKCNLCVNACPKRIIKMTEKGPIHNREECILCLCCFEACLSNAINIRKSRWRSITLGKIYKTKKILSKAKRKFQENEK